MALSQPIIRGIQAVGSVQVWYQYNSEDNLLPLPSGYRIHKSDATPSGIDAIDTKGGICLCGFRLDSEFFTAEQQIDTSTVIPILGGGGVALTNNNRTGTLSLTCAKVSTPEGDAAQDAGYGSMLSQTANGIGVLKTEGIDLEKVYDMVTIAQIQQSATGGDSTGASLCVMYAFAGRVTKLVFEGCTVARINPVKLTGNDAATYNVVWNYLNWGVAYNSPGDTRVFDVGSL